ncbi:MAG TPA: hypothetical protein VN476_02360 [Pyrinomonadaceae bacterium]|jgi:hypothetical protein|nr:hypothetical protein [Pyrinomonadaceae bacterium]
MVARRLVASVFLLTLAMAVLAANAGSCSAQAQSVPNLSGTWELIEYDGTKQKDLGDKFPKLTLVITQEGSQIRITQKRTKRGAETVQEYTYYTDGRGETNIGRLELWPREVPKLDFESVSSWQKDQLVTKYDSKLIPWTSSGQGARGFYTLNTVTSRRNDEWRLKADGKALVLTSSDAQVLSSMNTGSAPDPFSTFVTNKLVFRRL